MWIEGEFTAGWSKMKSTSKSAWFKCRLINNAKRAPFTYCLLLWSRTPVARVVVIYIVLFARTKVEMEATKMLLIIP